MYLTAQIAVSFEPVGVVEPFAKIYATLGEPDVPDIATKLKYLCQQNITSDQRFISRRAASHHHVISRPCFTSCMSSDGVIDGAQSEPDSLGDTPWGVPPTWLQTVAYFSFKFNFNKVRIWGRPMGPWTPPRPRYIDQKNHQKTKSQNCNQQNRSK